MKRCGFGFSDQCCPVVGHFSLVPVCARLRGRLGNGCGWRSRKGFPVRFAASRREAPGEEAADTSPLVGDNRLDLVCCVVLRQALFFGKGGSVVALAIELVAQLRREARLADGLLDAFGIERIAGAGRGNHVLLDHDRAEIVGPAVQCYLCRGFSHGEPRSLYVAYVVEEDAAQGDDAQVFERGEVRADPFLLEACAAAAEYPRNEGDESVVPLRALRLQVAQQQQVLDALCGSLHMAVHHGGRGGEVHPVGFAHHLAPLRHGGLAGRYAAAYLVAEDFGTRSGERIESRLAQPSQRFVHRKAADAGDMVDLGGTECVEPDGGVACLEAAEKLLVKADVEPGVEAALQEQLVASQAQGLLDLGVVGFGGGEVGGAVVGAAVEVAELAARNADIGDVHVAVYLPRDGVGVLHCTAAQGVGQPEELGGRYRPVEMEGFVEGERCPVERFAADGIESRHWDAFLGTKVRKIALRPLLPHVRAGRGGDAGNEEGYGISRTPSRILEISGLLLRDSLRRANACAGAAGDALVGVDHVGVITGRDRFGGAFSGAGAAGDADILINFVSHFFSV